MSRRKHKGCSWTFSLMIMVMLYPLSAGPIAWLIHNGYMPKSMGELLSKTIYAPIVWLFENNEWYHNLHSWYLSLWGI